ncbi:PadR family transcriptional regulator [bacterium]|jgi:DNA-binding PadR family transcriptional regulator|nr:PadR family transcriptional regulator [bacterium]
MNISDFVTIGVIEQLTTASGYDIIQEAECRKVQLWTGLKVGSIYHSIQKLEKKGYIEEVSKTQSGQRPTKTSYSVTDTGEVYFDTLQEESFQGLFPHFYGFLLGLVFNTRKTPEEIQLYAQNYANILDEKLEAFSEHKSDCVNLHLDPPEILVGRIELYMGQRKGLYQAERKWIDQVIKKSQVFDNKVLKEWMEANHG